MSALKKLREDLRLLFETSFNADVTLKVEPDNILAHSVILCQRSPVFSKMFEHDSSEKVNCVIDISDVDSNILKKFIAYLYSCELDEEDIHSLCDLYYIADKYEVVDLQILCGKALLSMLKVDNAGQILNLADRHSDEYLKKKTMEFISTHMSEVAETSGWIKFIDSKLSAEIILVCKYK